MGSQAKSLKEKKRKLAAEDRERLRLEAERKRRWPDVERGPTPNKQVVMTCTTWAATVETADLCDRAHDERMSKGGIKPAAGLNDRAVPRRYPAAYMVPQPWVVVVDGAEIVEQVEQVSFETAFEDSEELRLHLCRSGIETGYLGSSLIAGMPGAAEVVRKIRKLEQKQRWAESVL